MPTQFANTPKKEGIFTYLLLLTGFFFLLEISLFLQCNKAYLAGFSFVSSNLHIPITILPGILFFIAGQLSLHIAYTIIVWLIVNLLSQLPGFNKLSKILVAISVWTIGIITILFANNLFFPNSKFAELLLTVFPTFLTKIMFYVALVMAGMILLLASFSLLLKIVKSRFLQLMSGMFFLVIFISYGYFKFTSKPVIQDAASRARPNIFLIGIDALRPDFLGYFGGEANTVFFDNFLRQSTVFTQSITPLARTFPSWVGILSGEYPRLNSIRTNLGSQKIFKYRDTLPSILKRNGYETIYATDETRFSNIDKEFGFDKVITPPMGLNDFLLGTFNDFPMSNLIVNTPLGAWLFPHSYGNRPAYVTYEPNSFLRLLSGAFELKREKPVFMSVHFCLPHFPYAWADSIADEKTAEVRYRESLERVDQQVKDFFTILHERKLLDNAIVVLLSDHGEALELAGDRITESDLYFSSKRDASIPKFYPPSLDDEAVNKSAGHGTDVLGLTQYHTLLAFKLYGKEKINAIDVSQTVTLLDIKPTILSLLNLPITNSSGRSLADVILGTKSELSPEYIFLESDFSPEAIRTVYPETRKVLLAGIHLFQIDPKTTLLTVKNDMNQMIINSKQFAVIYNDWMLALYPKDNQSYIPILINLQSGQWTNELQSSLAFTAPVNDLFNQLKTFYGPEVSSRTTFSSL